MQKSVAIGAIVAAFAIAALPGCSPSEKTGCANNTDCPAAHICQSAKCEKLCDADVDCPAGTFCITGSTCATGTRETPRIDAIIGNSSATCSPGGIPGSCLGTGFVVQGANLGGSTFALLSGHGAICDATSVNSGIRLLPGSRNESAVVDLIPDGTVAAVDYTLCAVNAAGSDQGAISLLKGDKGDSGDPGGPGDPGPKGDSCWDIDQDGVCDPEEDIDAFTGCDARDCFGVPGTAGTNGLHCWDLDASGTCNGAEDVAAPAGCGVEDCRGADGTGGTGGSSVTYFYNNNTTPTEVTASFNRGVYQVPAGGSLNIPDTVFASLCGDGDGCQVEIGALGFQYAAEGGVDSSFWGPPCRLIFDPATRGWAASQACDWVYSSYWSGVDGDSTARVVLGVPYACYLAEGPSGSGFETCSSGDATGFVFFASPWTTTDAGDCSASNCSPGFICNGSSKCVPGWNQSGRSCALIIRD